jgi:heme-degrading monooxygenase HmoA
MILRCWTTRVYADRIAEYERFAVNESLSMFKQQRGNIGVFFTRAGTSCMVVSLWDSMNSVKALAKSATYRSTVDRIFAAGFLIGEPLTTVYVIQAGWLDPALTEALRRGGV